MLSTMVIYIFINLECSGNRLNVSILSGPMNFGEIEVKSGFLIHSLAEKPSQVT